MRTETRDRDKIKKLLADAAFPCEVEFEDLTEKGLGLSKREYIAIKVLQGLTSANVGAIATKRAVEYADALLKELGIER